MGWCSHWWTHNRYRSLFLFQDGETDKKMEPQIETVYSPTMSNEQQGPLSFSEQIH